MEINQERQLRNAPFGRYAEVLIAISRLHCEPSLLRDYFSENWVRLDNELVVVERAGAIAMLPLVVVHGFLHNNVTRVKSVINLISNSPSHLDHYGNVVSSFDEKVTEVRWPRFVLIHFVNKLRAVVMNRTVCIVFHFPPHPPWVSLLRASKDIIVKLETIVPHSHLLWSL